jgi:hypothetical protein
MQNFQFKTIMKGKRNLLHKLTLLLILLATTTFSQEIEWQNTIGGSSIDNLYSIDQTIRWRVYFGWIVQRYTG